MLKRDIQRFILRRVCHSKGIPPLSPLYPPKPICRSNHASSARRKTSNPNLSQKTRIKKVSIVIGHQLRCFHDRPVDSDCIIAERDSNSLNSYSSILPLKAFSTLHISRSKVSFLLHWYAECRPERTGLCSIHEEIRRGRLEIVGELSKIFPKRDYVYPVRTLLLIISDDRTILYP